MTKQVYHSKSLAQPPPLFASLEQNTTPQASNLMFHSSINMLPNIHQNVSATVSVPDTTNQNGYAYSTTQTLPPESAPAPASAPAQAQVPAKTQSQIPARSSPAMSSSLSSPSSIYFIPTDHPIPEFLHQLTKMLSDTENSNIISWIDKRIVVHDPPGLTRKVFHKYFRHSNYASFQRQLNYFGFRKVTGKKGKMHPCSYVHDMVTNDLRSLLAIKRKNTKKSSKASLVAPASSAQAPTISNAVSETSLSSSASHGGTLETSDDLSKTRPLHTTAAHDSCVLSTKIGDCAKKSLTITDAATTQDYISQKLGFSKSINSDYPKKRNHEGELKSPETMNCDGQLHSKAEQQQLNFLEKEAGTSAEVIPIQPTIYSNIVHISSIENPLSKGTINIVDKKQMNHLDGNLQFPVGDKQSPNSSSKNKEFIDYPSIIMDPKLYSSFQYSNSYFRDPNESTPISNEKLNKNQEQKTEITSNKNGIEFNRTVQNPIYNFRYPSNSDSCSTFPYPTLEQSHFEFMDLEKDLRSLGNYFQFNQNEKKPELVSSANHLSVNDDRNFLIQEPSSPEGVNDITQEEITCPNMAPSSFPNNGKSCFQSAEDNLYDIDDLDGFSFSFSKDKSFDIFLFKNTLGNDDLNKPSIPTTITHKN